MNMAEFEYRPDFCSVCHKAIAPDAPVVIIDDVVTPPHYYHPKCHFESFELVALIHGYKKT